LLLMILLLQSLLPPFFILSLISYDGFCIKVWLLVQKRKKK
jgi:hypothetical protein